MTKVQLTLTKQEASILSNYGKQFGYALPKTMKFILRKAMEKFYYSQVVPEYKLPKDLEERGLQALEADRKGETVEVDNFADFFGQLAAK
jgi:hypothetical protein